ncbi:unnamed protein product [Nippostrongylus brasiliensis]|uniref:CDC73_C domain-containing protein n=1 Tax=Nippostrongylus brasiliensis TaxID=27835 RepID=A0A0N4YYP5_NIPBR|nr:unnamed protein product [Nippostrongylus brasiliensis]
MMAGGAPTEPLVTRYSMDVRKVERVYKTRKTVMNATKKTYTFLFDVLKLIKSREEAARLKERGVDPSKSQPAKFVGMYNRYDQERFGKKQEDVMRRTALATTIPQTVSTPDEPKKRVSRTPIIIIPSAMTSLLTIFNATDIIQVSFLFYESHLSFNNDFSIGYEFRNDRTETQREKYASKYISIFDNNCPVLLPYLIVDQPNKFTDAEWDRVVAVFITGQLWQFKPFKRWHSNPVEIFAKIPAFHVHYDDLNIDSNVLKWSVTRLPVSRTKRHMDKARFRVFWETVDRWIPANRPHLRW